MQGLPLLVAYGLVLTMGSLALLPKYEQQVLGIFQLLMYFMLIVPREPWIGSTKFLAWLLPIAPGAGLLQALMAQEQFLEFSSSSRTGSKVVWQARRILSMC